MRRRDFLALFAGTASTLPVAARAAGKIARVGLLTLSAPAEMIYKLAAFRDGMHKLGYLEGQNIVLAAARLHHRLADLVPAQPRGQLAPTFRRACERTPQRQRTNANVHLVLGNINPRDNQIILCHHPAPFLARSGL